MLAPVVTAVGYAVGLRMGERLLTQRKTDFLRILVWPLVGCTLGAIALCWIGPMWVGIGTFIGGAASVVLREVKLLGRLTGCPSDGGVEGTGQNHP